MFKHVTPGTGSVLTQGASYEQTWYRSTRKCYIPNIKAVEIPLSEKKNLKFVFFVPMLQFVTARAGPVLTLGASYEQNLVEVHKVMLHTKCQSSRPYSFREEEL